MDMEDILGLGKNWEGGNVKKFIIEDPWCTIGFTGGCIRV